MARLRELARDYPVHRRGARPGADDRHGADRGRPRARAGPGALRRARHARLPQRADPALLRREHAALHAAALRDRGGDRRGRAARCARASTRRSRGARLEVPRSQRCVARGARRSRRRRRGPRRSRAGAEAGGPAAQLLLARALPAAAHDRPVGGELHCRTAPSSSTAWKDRSGGRRSVRPRRSRSRTRAAPTTTSRTCRATADPWSSPATTARAWNSGAWTWPADGRSRLTSGGDVNVEPRLSPDGRRLAWVSTRGTGHFNLYVADIDAAGLHEARPLLGERRSNIDRYYYSAFDHAVNPAWSPDGVDDLLRQQYRGSLGLGRPVGRAGREPGRAPHGAARGNDLERAPGAGALGRAPALQQLPRAAVAPAVAHHHGRRRAAAAHLRRLRQPQCALVAGRLARPLRQQRARRIRRSSCRTSSAARDARSSRPSVAT